MKKSELSVKIVNMTPNAVESVYRAYRVCYSKFTYDNMPIPSEAEMLSFIEKNLLKGHTTPLEHVSVTFSLEGVSRAAQQQMTRHRTGRYNIQSQRYVDGSNFGYVVPQLILDAGLEDVFAGCMEQCSSAYENLFEQVKGYLDSIYGQQKEHINMAKETARAVLPMATDSKMIVTFDLHNLRNFLRQRKCRHAQDEIKKIARLMEKEVRKHFSIIGAGISNCGNSCDCASYYKERLKQKAENQSIILEGEEFTKTNLIFKKSKFIEASLENGLSLSNAISVTWIDGLNNQPVYKSKDGVLKAKYSVTDDVYAMLVVIEAWCEEVKENE